MNRGNNGWIGYKISSDWSWLGMVQKVKLGLTAALRASLYTPQYTINESGTGTVITITKQAQRW